MQNQHELPCSLYKPQASKKSLAYTCRVSPQMINHSIRNPSQEASQDSFSENLSFLKVYFYILSSLTLSLSAGESLSFRKREQIVQRLLKLVPPFCLCK